MRFKHEFVAQQKKTKRKQQIRKERLVEKSHATYLELEIKRKANTADPMRPIDLESGAKIIIRGGSSASEKITQWQ